MAKLAVWLGGLVTFEQAAEILRRIGRIGISRSSIWRLVQRWGKGFAEIEEAERKVSNALPGRKNLLRLASRSAGRMGVGVDGMMMHIRDEGWKELKIGCVFELEVRSSPDPETGDLIEQAHAVNNSYRVHLGGPERFGETVWTEASQRGWERALDTQVIGDGAHWIWNLVQDHFYNSLQIVDWYHATEHLAQAARILKGEGTPAAKLWYNARKTTLLQGHADRIADELNRAAQKQPARTADLQREAGYFQNNKRRMHYLAMRESGWIIGSGMVESGAKMFKARFSGPGMRWSRTGAENLLPVRSALLSRRFDARWRLAYHSPHN